MRRMRALLVAVVVALAVPALAVTHADPTTGLATINYSATGSVTVAVVRVP